MSSTSAALTSIQELSAEDCAAATRWSRAAIFSRTEDWPNAREHARRLIPRLTRTAAARGRRIVNSLILGSLRRGTLKAQAVLYKARPRTPGKNTAESDRGRAISPARTPLSLSETIPTGRGAPTVPSPAPSPRGNSVWPSAAGSLSRKEQEFTGASIAERE